MAKVQTKKECTPTISIAQKCSWCVEYYQVYGELCSTCDWGSQHGFTKKTQADIMPAMNKLKWEADEAYRKALVDELIENKMVLTDEEFQVIYNTIKFAVQEFGSAIRSKHLHGFLMILLPKDRYLLWKHAVELFKLFKFRKFDTYGSSDKTEYEMVLCSRVKDCWNIRSDLMPEGHCYYCPTIVPQDPDTDMLVQHNPNLVIHRATQFKFKD